MSRNQNALRLAMWALVALLAVAVAPPGIVGAETVAPGSNAEVVNTGGDGLRVRVAPSFSAATVGGLPESAVVSVIGGPHGAGAEGWAQVSYGGVTGWVRDQHLAPATERRAATSSRGGSREADLGGAIAQTALHFVGYRYVLGGASPGYGFDCSGLVQYVLHQHGISVSHTTYAQVGYGRRVASSELIPGDLVFFENTYGWGISHVGIYIGRGQFVHAGTERTGVRVDSVWDVYWGAHYYGARRVR